MASGGSAIMALPTIDPNADYNEVVARPAKPVDVKTDTNYDRFQQPAQTVSRLTGDKEEEETQARLAMLARLKKRLKRR
jgi:hypothetical protein